MPVQREELAQLWREINREMHDSFRQAFSGYDHSPVTLVLIRQVATEPGIIVSELARRARIAKSHVSKLVDQLVQQGYFEKRPDPSDQRLVRLYLTERAAHMKAELEGQVLSVLNGIISEVPEHEVEAIVHGLRLLRSALQKSNEKVNT
jgi:DNA-binding MarR family transcriptional regulator